jgi:integrase
MKMALYKRNGIYHCDFTVNGERYRQTLETGDKREAVQRERDLVAQAKQGKLAGRLTDLARVNLPEAFDRYLKERELEISNARHEWDCSKPLRSFFESKRLNQITGDDIRAFQAHRIGQGKKPKTVNLEVGLLLRLLKRAKLRHFVADDVRLLTVVREPRQMLTAVEKQRVFETASTKPEWQTAYCAALLTANTSMRPKELRRLLWCDLDPLGRLITVRRSKTEAGTRVIPLNEEAWSAIAAMKRRADAVGTYAPEYYIFHREWPKVDPARPMSGWRSAWRSLRKAAAEGDKEKGLEAIPRLAKLRFYDLRHQFVTELCEAGVPESVIRELAGHVDPQMMRIYSHPRVAARRAAVETLGSVSAVHQTLLLPPVRSVDVGQLKPLDVPAIGAAQDPNVSELGWVQT